MRTVTWLLIPALLLPACSRDEATTSATPAPSASQTPAVAPPASVAPAGAPPRNFGEVMAEVGSRFQMAGQAEEASRFEMAAFQVGELGELFEDDLPHASLPKEGPTAQIPGMMRAFVASNIPELQKAANARDPKAFAGAFASAAEACNGCHVASAKGFIEIPSVPGKAVPDLSPVPASARGK